MKLIHIVDKPPFYTNCFLVIGAAGQAIAIDPAAKAKEFNDALEKNGATLTAILLTHGHHDHVGSVKALKEQHGAKVYMSKADADFFKLDADEFYSDGEEIEFGEMKIKPIFTPGHTPGSTCLLCGGWLFSGDTLFHGDIGRTDLPGGDTTEIYKSLKKLCEIVYNNPQVLPGHEEFSTMNDERKYNPSIIKACKM